MSDSQTVRGPSPEQAALLADRTNLLLRMLRGDAPALAMDALLSAYASVAIGFDRRQQGAHFLKMAGGILENNSTPEGIQAAINAIPAGALKVPMPERPAGPLPDGYAAADIERVEALVASILALLEGDKGHIGLSALITCYAQVAAHLGESDKAAKVLLETGARLMAGAQPTTSSDAGAPVPAVSSKLH